MRNYRLSYYEDDCVVYNSRGTHPFGHVNNKPCVRIFKKGEKRQYRKFDKEQTAEIALRYQLAKTMYGGKHPYKSTLDAAGFRIFKCSECGCYHIISSGNFRRYESLL